MGDFVFVLTGFATRRIALQEPVKSAHSLRETLLFVPDWRPVAQESVEAPKPAGHREVVLCGWPAAFSDALAAELPGWSCRGVEGNGAAVDGGFKAYAEALLSRMHALSRSSKSAVLQVVIS